MNEPMVCEALRNGMTPEELYEKHGVKMRPHNGKASLCYDQIDSRDDDILAQECRGLVLSIGDWRVLARPFDRFFNLGQGAAAKLDWGTVTYEEKHDGTLLIVYHDAGRWQAATRLACEAHFEMQGGGTFAELADEAARNHGAASLHELVDQAGIDRGLTLMFELTAPHNRIIVRYESPSLTLIGVRDRETGREWSPDVAASTMGVPRPMTYSAKDPVAMATLMADWDPTEHEGVVAKDAMFRRVKIKTPAYMAAHRMIDSVGASWRAVVEVVQSGRAAELAATLSDYHRERIERASERCEELIAAAGADAAELASIENQKEFAMAAKERRWSAALFAVRSGKAESVRAFFRQARPDHVLEILGEF